MCNAYTGKFILALKRFYILDVCICVRLLVYRSKTKRRISSLFLFPILIICQSRIYQCQPYARVCVYLLGTNLLEGTSVCCPLCDLHTTLLEQGYSRLSTGLHPDPVGYPTLFHFLARWQAISKGRHLNNTLDRNLHLFHAITRKYTTLPVGVYQNLIFLYVCGVA